MCNFQLRFKAHKNNPYIADDSVVAWVSVQCTVYSVQCTVYSVHCFLYCMLVLPKPSSVKMAKVNHFKCDSLSKCYLYLYSIESIFIYLFI